MSAKRTDAPIFTEEQKTLIREHLLKDAPEFEIERFFITCERTGLDPFSRQIYGHIQNTKVKRGGQELWVKTVTIITGIDGFRAIAERSGEYRGQTPPEWYYVNEEGKAGWWNVFVPKRHKGRVLTLPEACRVGILRAGFVEPCYGVANFDSFAKFTKIENEWQLDLFWNKMPEHMIAKVAEAQGIRKAFPLLACGLYVEEEVRDDEAPQPEPGEITNKAGAPLPEGMTYVPGHSPEERAKVVSAPSRPEEDEKAPAEAPSEPATPPKKTRGPRKAPAAEPPPADTPENTPLTPEDQDELPGLETAPAKEPDKRAASSMGELDWRNYVITAITITKYAGRKLSSFSIDELRELKTSWVERFAEKIALNPVKATEAAMITAAFNAHTK